MKVLGLLAAVFALNAGSALAVGVPQISCTNGEGFEAILDIDTENSLAQLTYGYEGDMKVVEDLDSSFVGDVGAASKSGEALMVITPIGGQRVGQLLIDGKTYIMSCRRS